MSTSTTVYPWYGVVRGDDLEQGDILERLPVFSLQPDSAADTEVSFERHEENIIIVSQSCDLVKGREKPEDELLACPLWVQGDFAKDHHLATTRGMEDLRRGNLPGFHLIAACALPEFQRNLRIVDFGQVYSLPIRYVRNRIREAAHIRLLPPYREHLSQAFARYFMRVGLPIDIKPFK